jgi:hypothetical protein
MRYDHHPEPASAFCIEADIIEGMLYDFRVGVDDGMALRSRVRRALQFRVGADASATLAKSRLREIASEINVLNY